MREALLGHDDVVSEVEAHPGPDQHPEAEGGPEPVWVEGEGADEEAQDVQHCRPQGHRPATDHCIQEM